MNCHRFVAPATLLAMLLTSAVARAGEPGVRDDARILQPDTVSNVDRQLAAIKQQFGKDVVVETVGTIPEEKQQAFSSQPKQRFYEEWITSEGRRLNVDGLLILIVRRPGHLQVGVGSQTRKRAFTAEDRDELVRRMAEAFKQRAFDRGLLEGVQFVNERMARNLKMAPAAFPATQPAATEPGGEPAPAPQTAPAATEPETKPAAEKSAAAQ